ncbi:MAG: hypothetical protein LIO77_04685, partial [Rikenellaceae bacterium]|nr:hypothetical protein [Rikenellaceae bacterium]
SGWGGAGSGGRNRPAGTDGYGQGRPVYGREASQHASIRSETVKPALPSGKNLRSIGSRIKPQGDRLAPSPGIPALPGQIVAGARVAHQKFGRGTVDAVEQASGDQKITVVFDDSVVGRKTLLGKYARLTIVE